MTGLVGRITTRQIVPRSAGTQNPKDTVQHRSRILPRPATPVLPAFRTKHWFEHRPLGVGEFHVPDLRRLPSDSTAQRLECVYEITSSG